MTHTEKYLEWLKYGRQLSDNTITAISNDFKHFGDDLENATRSDVEMWVMKMNKDGLSTATVARRLSSISGFFEWQIYNELRNGSNPAKGKIAPKIKNTSHEAISKDELDMLYNNSSGVVRTAIALMGYAGLRIGEVANLGIINHVYYDTSGKQAISLKQTKGDKERDVSLALLPNEIIGKPLQGQRGPLSANALWRRVRKYFDDMGFHNLSPHGLRATFTTILSENQVQEVIIADMLGHTSTENLNNITMRYIKTTTPEQQAQALEAIR